MIRPLTICCLSSATIPLRKVTQTRPKLPFRSAERHTKACNRQACKNAFSRWLFLIKSMNLRQESNWTGSAVHHRNPLPAVGNFHDHTSIFCSWRPSQAPQVFEKWRRRPLSSVARMEKFASSKRYFLNLKHTSYNRCAYVNGYVLQIYVYIYMCVCVHTYLYLYLYLYIFIHIYILINICV